ncbi:MAG: hypothetical protein AVDCRST_MAG73-95, partial [uncultured Thermomicrobiales bacterium]
ALPLDRPRGGVADRVARALAMGRRRRQVGDRGAGRSQGDRRPLGQPPLVRQALLRDPGHGAARPNGPHHRRIGGRIQPGQGRRQERVHLRHLFVRPLRRTRGAQFRSRRTRLRPRRPDLQHRRRSPAGRIHPRLLGRGRCPGDDVPDGLVGRAVPGPDPPDGGRRLPRRQPRPFAAGADRARRRRHRLRPRSGRRRDHRSRRSTGGAAVHPLRRRDRRPGAGHRRRPRLSAGRLGRLVRRLVSGRHGRRRRSRRGRRGGRRLDHRAAPRRHHQRRLDRRRPAPDRRPARRPRPPLRDHPRVGGAVPV